MMAAHATGLRVGVRASRSAFVGRLPDSKEKTGDVRTRATTKHFGRDVRGLKEAGDQSKEKIQAAKGHNQSDRWGLAAVASFFPWLQIGGWSSKASELLDATATAANTLESELEAVDISSLLAGDIAMLVAAPLVVYAALRLVFWDSQEESDLAEEEDRLNPMLRANVCSVVKAPMGNSPSSYVSQLTDPDLQLLAGKTAQNIITSVRDVKVACAFKSGLHDLAVKHGGAEDDFRWIIDVLQNAPPEVKDETGVEADRLTSQAGNLSNKDLCRMVTRAIAQRVAMHEVDSLVQALQEHERNKSGRGLFQ